MPDVIHAHMVHANIFARINQIYHIKVTLICSAHSSNEGGKNKNVSLWNDELLITFEH